MSALIVEPPFEIFTDIDGQPLDDGYVFIGAANLNPQTNPINVYFDQALTILAAQPLRTNGGYIVNAGTPARIFVDAATYSILVMNKNGSTLYTLLNATGIDPNACGVEYTPPFVGAVAYPVCEKLDQVISVKDFGAVGDGVADDTVAFNAALIAANDKTLYVPDGSYLITSTLRLRLALNNKPRVIYGNGNLLYQGTGACIHLDGSSPSAFQRLEMRDLNISAFGNANTNLIGIWIDGSSGGNQEASRCSFYGVGIREFTTTGSFAVRMQRCWLNMFFGCTFEFNRGGVRSAGTVNNNSFFGCRWNNNTGDGFIHDDGNLNAMLFSGCEFEAHGGTGIKVASTASGATNITIDTCYFEENKIYDIHLNNSNCLNTEIRNNFHFLGGTSVGNIYLQNAQRVIMTGGSFFADPLETDPGLKSDMTGSQIRGPFSISGWNSGANFFDYSVQPQLIAYDNGDLSTNNSLSSPFLEMRPLNTDKRQTISRQPAKITGLNQLNNFTLSKSIAVTHTNGVATNIDIPIVDGFTNASERGWVSGYITLSYTTGAGSANLALYSATYVVSAAYDPSGVIGNVFSLAVQIFFASGGAISSAAHDSSGTFAVRTTWASGALTQSGVLTLDGQFQLSAVAQ